MLGALRRLNGPVGVVLSGSAGVGKSRLARAALDAIAGRGGHTRWSVATVSSRAVPLAVFADAAPARGDDPPDGDLVHQVASALVPDRPGARMVIAIDDAHLLDPLSATVVLRLAVTGAARLLLTVRSGAPTPDAVTALWKDGYLTRLEVQPLSEAETAALVEQVVGAPVATATVTRMFALTQGNVLYLRHLTDGEIAASRLHEHNGLWRWTGTPTLSPGLVELVQGRMGVVTEPVRDVVDLLAVGEPLSVDLLSKLTDPDAVEESESLDLITVERDGRRLQARLAHPLYGETRRASIGTLRSRRLRGMIAEAMAASGGRRAEDSLRRAVLSLESDLAPDPLLFTDAAEHAAQLGDLPLAERLARAAVDAGAGFRAQTVVAQVLTVAGRPEEAARELSRLTLLADDESELVSATVTRVIHLLTSAGRPADAEAALDEAVARVADPQRPPPPLTALRVFLDGARGRPAQAIAGAPAALDDATLPDESVVLACFGLVAALASSGRADEMEPHVARAVAAMGRSGFATFRLSLIALQVAGLRLAGYVDRAAEVAAACLQQAQDHSFAGGVASYLVGEAELGRGRLDAAARLLRDAQAELEAFGNSAGWRHVALIALVQVAAIRGDHAGAQQVLAELRARPRSSAMAFREPENALAAAWGAAAEGAVTQAITMAKEVADVAAERAQHAHEVLALQTAVRFGDRTVADRLVRLAGTVDGPRAPAAAAHAVALAAADGAALDAASARWEDAGDVLAAADAAAQAALAHRGRGARAAEHASASRANDLADRCGGARTPALAAAARPLPLTDREREVATMIAAGLSNRDIAERLVVSVRTVEGHVYRACIKLGLSDRGAIADLMRPAASPANSGSPRSTRTTSPSTKASKPVR